MSDIPGRLKDLVFPQAGGIERVNVAVTYHCNSRCVMCNIWKEDYSDGVLASRLVTLDEYRTLFSDPQYFSQLREVGITGGEPFLRPDMDEIVRFFLKTFPGLSMGITTNAFTTKLITDAVGRILDGHDLAAHGQSLGISLSIDGVGEVHDEIRGVPGAYDRVLETLESLKKNFPQLHYGLSLTLLDSNYEQVWPVYQVAKERGVALSFRFAQTSGSFYLNDEMAFQWTEDILQNVESQVERIHAESDQLDNFFYNNMVNYQAQPRELMPCYSGRHSFFLDPYGEVFPCILVEKSFGNVKQQPFHEIWGSDDADAARNWIWDTHCHCWTQCEAEVTQRRSWQVARAGARRRLGLGSTGGLADRPRAGAPQQPEQRIFPLLE